MAAHDVSLVTHCMVLPELPYLLQSHYLWRHLAKHSVDDDVKVLRLLGWVGEGALTSRKRESTICGEHTDGESRQQQIYMTCIFMKINKIFNNHSGMV